MRRREVLVVLAVLFLGVNVSFSEMPSGNTQEDIQRLFQIIQEQQQQIELLKGRLAEKEEVFVESVKERVKAEIKPEITTAASLHQQEKEGWFASAEVSFLKPGGLDDIDFAVMQHPDDSEGSIGEMYSIGFGWEPGWRISTGYRFDDGNEIAATYWGTRINSSKTVTDSDGDLRATLPHCETGDADDIDYAKATMKVNINRFGIDFTHPFYENNKIRLTGGIGLDYLHLQQNLYVDYRDGGVNEVFIDAKVRNHMFGPRFSVGTEYTINDKISFEGICGLSLMAHRSTLRQVEDAIRPSTVDAPIDITDKRNNVTPIFDTLLGLTWRPNDSWKFGFGYEFMWMHDVHTLQRGLDDTSEGQFIRTNHGLTLHGVKFNTIFTF